MSFTAGTTADRAPMMSWIVLGTVQVGQITLNFQILGKCYGVARGGKKKLYHDLQLTGCKNCLGPTQAHCFSMVETLHFYHFRTLDMNF